MRNELTLREGVTHGELNGTRPYEMGIEVSEASLRRYGLSFEDVFRWCLRFWVLWLIVPLLWVRVFILAISMVSNARPVRQAAPKW